MIDSHLKKLTDEVARRYDELVEACFLVAGFNRDYLREHLHEFWRELLPEGRCTYYRGNTPLFTVVQKIESDFENHKLLVTHEVAWPETVEGEKNYV